MHFTMIFTRIIGWYSRTVTKVREVINSGILINYVMEHHVLTHSLCFNHYKSKVK